MRRRRIGEKAPCGPHGASPPTMVKHMKIFYIHGFNSYKGSSTPKKLHQAIGTPIHELYYHSEQTFDEIMQDLKSQYLALCHGEPSIIAGTSMGGFFADQLCEMPNVHAIVLINPVVDPVEVLSKETFLGEQENFITHEKYIFTKEIAQTYGTRADLRAFPVKRYLLLAEHDELLNPETARNYWGSCARTVPLEGGHRLTDFGTVARILCAIMPEDEYPNEYYAG